MKPEIVTKKHAAFTNSLNVGVWFCITGLMVMAGLLNPWWFFGPGIFFIVVGGLGIITENEGDR